MHLKSALFSNKSNNRRGLFWATRTRIFLWYVLTITFISMVSIPIFPQLLYFRVDARVRKDLVERIQIFNQSVKNEADTSVQKSDAVNEAESEEIEVANNRFVRPSSQEQLKDFFDAFLNQQLPEDETFLMTFMDGKFYKSTPRGRPEIFERDSKLMRRWAKLVKPEKGEKELPDSELGGIIYIVQPVKIQGKNLGVFVIAHTVSDERQEAIEAIGVIVQVISVVVLGALILAWIASGRVLTPLRSLSATARSISESDLSQRIPVHGKDELADVATTFNEMMDRLEAAFTTQRHFINDAGHQLRTPITIIKAYLQLMDDEDPEETDKTLGLVFDELDRISRLVEDLILLAKAERPDFLQLETVDVASLTQELFAKAQALGERNWCLDKTGQGMTLVDPQKLTQATMKLAQNATQNTTSTDTIAIGSSITQGKVKFWVRDTGEGINEREQQIIFERFVRSTRSRSHCEGVGLGLSIVKIIAQAHHGEVILHSQPGEGANFCIVLPVKQFSLR